MTESPEPRRQSPPDAARYQGRQWAGRRRTPVNPQHAHLLVRVLRLNHELAHLREVAHKLPYSSIQRWRLSLRADAIGKQLQAIEAERNAPR